MLSQAEILCALPERGFGVVRGAGPFTVLALEALGLVKAQAVDAGAGVWHVRLTGAGRRARRQAPEGKR